MFEVINKAFLVGVGLAATSGEKVEELAEELAEKGKLSQAEARKLADDMVAKSAKARKDFKIQVENWLEQSLHKMHLPTKDDIEGLKGRITKLEKADRKK